MNLIKNLFSSLDLPAPTASQKAVNQEKIVELLKQNPDAYAAFKKAYAAVETPANRGSATTYPTRRLPETMEQLAATITNDLLAISSNQKAIETSDAEQTQLLEHIESMELVDRPLLTATHARTDMGDEPSFPMVMSFYKDAIETKNPARAQYSFMQFLQGLDIMDLDPVLYELLSLNPNAMSKWLPALEVANATSDFFTIPKTKIVKVPLTILQMSRIPFDEFNNSAISKKIVNDWVTKAFDLKPDGDYFIKTGTFSQKFDFRNARVHDPKEIAEMGEYFIWIQYMANQMAMPLNHTVTPGASTTNEWVVREFIEDVEANETIYHGLPLRTEFRVFIDCDQDEVLGVANYWEPNLMKSHFASRAASKDPDAIHDAVTYSLNEESLVARFEEHKDRIVAEVARILPALNLKGQWSLDIMKNGEDYYLIDMAIAASSTHYKDIVAIEKQQVETIWSIGA